MMLVSKPLIYNIYAIPKQHSRTNIFNSHINNYRHSAKLYIIAKHHAMMYYISIVPTNRTSCSETIYTR